MTDSTPASRARPRGIRWWPAVAILTATLVIIIVFRLQETPFQRRNLQTLVTLVIAGAALFLWWVTCSRARWRLRLAVAALALGLVGLGVATFRIRGVSGDLMPILEPRWARSFDPPPVATRPTPPPEARAPIAHPDFPQFLGPTRTGTLPGVALDPDWPAHPPAIVWRQPIGAAWSGFAVVGERAVTQEQRDDQESVTCYDLRTGRLWWVHGDLAHYQTTIAGEGPRCTPTIVSNRVFTLGATGLLNCLDLETGRPIWQRNLTNDTGAKQPEWGFAGSPLVLDGRVIVSAGGQPDKSLVAFDAATGELVWAAGDAPISYGSPVVADLAGTRQILAFNSRRIAAHDPVNGRVLWEYPWGIGQPHVAVPVVVATNRVVFSSGYGVGAELLEIGRSPDGGLAVSRVWQSRRMKAKFANPFARAGLLYGLDDGILACVDLIDGSQRWKEGRYGHGQGLLVGDHYLLMTERGELVLLKPTPEGPNELHRFPVFNSKTWNPIALAGEWLLVRNDLEAACLRVALDKASH